MFHAKIKPEMVMKILNWGDLPAHVTYDPAVNKDYQYRINRCSSHDGTLIFTHELYARMLEPLLEGTSFYKQAAPDWTKVKQVKYRVGDVLRMAVDGLVDLPCGRYPGCKEMVSIPVVCEFDPPQSLPFRH